MKKYIILLLPILVMLFGSVSFAYTGPTGATYEYEYVFTEGANTLRFYSNYLFFGVSQNNSSRPELCAFIPNYPANVDDPNKYIVTTVVTGRNTYYMYNSDKKWDNYNNLGYDQQWTTWAELKYNSGQSTANWPVTWTPAIYQAANVPVFTTYENAYNWAWDQLQPHIDFVNKHYDPTIPTPDIWTVYNLGDEYVGTEDNGGNFTLPDIIPYVLYLEGFQALTNYNVYIGIRFYTPTGGTLERKGGFDYFTANDYIKSDIYDFLPYEELWNAPTASRARYDLNSDTWTHPNTFWHNFRLDANSEMSWNMIGYSSDNAKNKAKNDTLQYLKNAGIYGNRFEIFVTYFQVRDEKVYVGNTAHWYSVQPETTNVEQLSNITNNQDTDANGYENVITQEQLEETSESTSNQPPLNITDYGTSVTVNVDNGSQYVPNNQNYPTVVSYNHDNIFTQFVGTYQTAGQYLGDFGNFVQATFAWIPGQVWTLIMMGFGMALVIMILKII